MVTKIVLSIVLVVSIVFNVVTHMSADRELQKQKVAIEDLEGDVAHWKGKYENCTKVGRQTVKYSLGGSLASAFTSRAPATAKGKASAGGLSGALSDASGLPGSESAAPADAQGPKTPQDVVCNYSKALMGMAIRLKGNEIIGGLRHHFANREGIANHIRGEVTGLAKHAGLNQAQAEKLYNEYSSIKMGIMDRIGSEISKGRANINYESVLDNVKSLYAEEDRLIERNLGASYKGQLRQHKLPERTLVLSIISALGKKNLDEALNF